MSERVKIVSSVDVASELLLCLAQRNRPHRNGIDFTQSNSVGRILDGYMNTECFKELLRDFEGWVLSERWGRARLRGDFLGFTFQDIVQMYLQSKFNNGQSVVLGEDESYMFFNYVFPGCRQPDGMVVRTDLGSGTCGVGIIYESTISKDREKFDRFCGIAGMVRDSSPLFSGCEFLFVTPRYFQDCPFPAVPGVKHLQLPFTHGRLAVQVGRVFEEMYPRWKHALGS